MNELLTVGDVARLAGVSPQAVRVWERTGKLPAERTVSGIRLFRRDDAERVVQERERRTATTAA